MDKKRLINTFLEIVQVDSPTGCEGNMVQWILNKLKSLGLSPIKDDYGNVIVKHVGSTKPILLAAHLDTVEPGRGVKPVIQNEIIISSGDTILGADNKVGVAVILEVLETLVEKKSKVAVEVVFTLSEEIGNLGAINLDYSLIAAKNGFAFDTTGLLGEIVTAAPFYNRFDVEVVGIAGHAGKPEKAINALKIFGEALNKFKLGRVDADTICNIGVVNGGSVRNTIPGKIIINGEVRSFVESKLESVTNKIILSFNDAAKSLGGKVISDVVRENGGYKLSKNDPIVQQIVRVMERQKIKPRLRKSLGCSDSNIFCDHGLSIINMSDGSEKPHTVEENISVENLTKLAELVFGLVNDEYFLLNSGGN